MAASITAYCASCGEDREADAQSGRCLKCGKLSTTHLPTRSLAEVERNADVHRRRSPSADYLVGRFDPSRSVAATSATPAAALPQPTVQATSSPDAPRVRLPNSRPTEKWLETTRTLMVGFTAGAAEAEQKAAALEAKVADQVAAFKAEAVRLRNSARVMRQLLEQVGIEAKESASPAVKRSSHGSPLAPGKWSRQHAACIDCGRTDRKHSCNGRCVTCDVAWRKRGKVDA